MKRGIVLLPNLLTTFSLFLGFFAIVKALHHDFVTAAWAIFIAGIFDNLDGRLARMTGGDSKFGTQYDSLADLVSFGLAPAVLIYGWSLASFPRLGWVVCFLYLACGCLRLARFNVQVNTVERNYFQGLPIPMAAGPVILTILFYQAEYGPVFPLRNWWLAGMMVLLALLMVSTVRYRSLKQLRLSSRWSFVTLVAVVGFFTLVALQPERVLFVTSLVYLASGPIETGLRWALGKTARDQRAERRAERVARDVLRKKIRILPGHQSTGSEQ